MILAYPLLRHENALPLLINWQICLVHVDQSNARLFELSENVLHSMKSFLKTHFVTPRHLIWTVFREATFISCTAFLGHLQIVVCFLGFFCKHAPYAIQKLFFRAVYAGQYGPKWDTQGIEISQISQSLCFLFICISGKEVRNSRWLKHGK